jgi:hypothetical protein
MGAADVSLCAYFKMTIRASILQFVHACLQQQQIIASETFSGCEGYAFHVPTF